MYIAVYTVYLCIFLKFVYSIFSVVYVLIWSRPCVQSEQHRSTQNHLCTGCPMLCFAVMAVRPVSDLLENDCLQKSSLVRSHFPSATLNDDATAAGGRDHRSNGANKSAACS